MTPEQQSEVQHLLNVEEGLTEWEIEFLDSLFTERWETPLSERQAAKLEDIYTKKGF